jgi:hypothetical protein
MNKQRRNSRFLYKDPKGQPQLLILIKVILQLFFSCLGIELEPRTSVLVINTCYLIPILEIGSVPNLM